MSYSFRYFERPHDFSTYDTEAKRCDICGEMRPGYGGPFDGERDDIERVCEECLATGRLSDLDMETNEGDVAALRASLAALRPELSEAERERIVGERDDELCHMTPYPVTWQGFFWPARCGDYCRYIKEVGRRDLLALAPEGDGPAFLAAHDFIAAKDKTGRARLAWNDIRPDAPTYIAADEWDNAYLVGVYLFRCLSCDEPLLLME
jgi:uncharacterized protein CbrC (UPF0167 family)